MSNKTILVAFGGASPEHEVSVLTAMQSIAALRERNHTIIPLYIGKTGRWYTGTNLTNLEEYKDLKALIASSSPCTFAHNENGRVVLMETASKGIFSKPKSFQFDVVLPSFHGSDGENGAFQGVCETFNIPYAGSGVLGSAVGMDKLTAKSLCRSANFPVVDDVGFYESEWVANKASIIETISALGYPVFVKPVSLGSSIGVTRASDQNSLINAVESAFRYDRHILVEKGVSPLKEINCSVMGTPENATASVLEHPMGSEELLSFKDKYQRGEGAKGMASADRIIPAELPSEKTEEIRTLAVQIFKNMNCSGLARLDFLLNAETNEVFFNEINTIPGSFSFYLWDHSDISFPQLLEQLISIALEQHQQKNGRVRSYETNLLSQKAAVGLKGLKGTKGPR